MNMKFRSGRRFDYLQFRLDVLSALLDKEATAVLRKELNVSVRELRILRMINVQSLINQSELARFVALEKTIVSKLVSSLNSRNLIYRTINSDDARQINLHLTDEGLAIVKNADIRTRLLEKKFLSVLTSEELDSLFGSLKKLILHATNFEKKRE